MSDRLQLEDRSTLQERVTMSIRKAIIEGYWKDGDKIRQEELSQMLNVSRMPIREALRQLAVEGLVTLEHHRGAIVNPITERDVTEVYELRSRLESLAAELAVPNLLSEDFDTLDGYNARMQEAADRGDTATYIALNREFHFYIYKNSDWRRLGILINTLWNGLPPYAPSLLSGQIELSNEDHVRLLDLMRRGEAVQAGELMARHIRRTGDKIIQFIRNRNEQQGRG